jgi:hypothetical protein
MVVDAFSNVVMMPSLAAPSGGARRDADDLSPAR